MALALGSISASNAQKQKGGVPDPSDGKLAEQAYKNIQVLKGISADQLIPSMEFITASLGVECGFCHVERQFDKDDKKPKQTARKMMQMMMGINEANFQGHQVVTCNTCHRGSRLPAGIPVISDQPSVGRTKTTEEDKLPPNLPSVDELLSKYVQAEGGASAIEKISTRMESGKATFFGRQIEIEVLDKSPDKRVSILHLPDGENVTGFNGREGWLSYPHRPVLSMSSGELEGARMDADLQFPLHVRNYFPELRPGQPEKINGQDAFQLVAFVHDAPRARLYFDQQSGLLLRLVRYADTPLGPNPTRTDFADYRAVDGAQVPFKWTTARPAGQFTIELSDVKQNVVIDDARFAKPQLSNANEKPAGAQ
jgi:hypothetical protein